MYDLTENNIIADYQKAEKLYRRQRNKNFEARSLLKWLINTDGKRFTKSFYFHISPSNGRYYGKEFRLLGFFKTIEDKYTNKCIRCGKVFNLFHQRSVKDSILCVQCINTIDAKLSASDLTLMLRNYKPIQRKNDLAYFFKTDSKLSIVNVIW